MVIVMLLGANVAARSLLALTPGALNATAHYAFWVLTAIAYMAIAHVPSVTGSAYPKPVIVFSEPSDFSFVYLPFLIFTVANATRGRQMLLLLSGLLIGMLLENLTMLVGILGASCLILRRYQILLLLAGLVLGAGVLALDLSYYADRLALSADSDNLSTLVYLQGWERALLNLQETDGVGVGFQQFGYVGSLGDISQKILLLAHTNLNLYDGGSTGSKLIAELGVVGILMVVLYLRLLVRGALLIRRAQQLPAGTRDRRRIFFYSVVVAYGSELFIRGTGYFSPSGFFLLTALIAIPALETARYRSRRASETTGDVQPQPGGATLNLPTAALK
jgi:hypothetical protein